MRYFRAWARGQLEVTSPFFSRTHSAIGFPVLASNSSSLLGALNASAAGWAAVKVVQCWLDAPIENAKLFSTNSSVVDVSQRYGCSDSVFAKRTRVSVKLCVLFWRC